MQESAGFWFFPVGTAGEFSGFENASCMQNTHPGAPGSLRKRRPTHEGRGVQSEAGLGDRWVRDPVNAHLTRPYAENTEPQPRRQRASRQACGPKPAAFPFFLRSVRAWRPQHETFAGRDPTLCCRERDLGSRWFVRTVRCDPLRRYRSLRPTRWRLFARSDAAERECAWLRNASRHEVSWWSPSCSHGSFSTKRRS